MNPDDPESDPYFLKRYTEDMNRTQTARAEIDEQIAAYERQLRRQMLFDEELAELAARQRERPAAHRLLPVLPLGQPSAARQPEMRA